MAGRARDCNASLAVAKHSGCPSGRWQDAIAPLLVASRTAANLTLVNVGANKGYNVAEFLQRCVRRLASPLAFRLSPLASLLSPLSPLLS